MEKVGALDNDLVLLSLQFKKEILIEQGELIKKIVQDLIKFYLMQ